MSNPFAVLGIPETADDATVHKAYLHQVRAYPPDRDPQRFQAIRTAFETLRTQRDRLRYRLFNVEQPTLSQLLCDDVDHTTQPLVAARPPLSQLQDALRSSLNRSV